VIPAGPLRKATCQGELNCQFPDLSRPKRVPFSGPALEIRYLMEDHIEVEGKVIAVLAGTMFRVELDNKHIVLATISGKMRKRFVRLTPGDRVKMKMSTYDLNKARIIWRIG
jgi:translation initiation factor IF-1